MTRSVSLSDTFLLVTAAVVPAVFGIGFFDKYALPKLLTASAALAAAAALRLQEKRSMSSAVDLPMAGLSVAVMLSALASGDPWTSWIGLERLHTYGVLGLALCGLGFCLSCGAGDGYLHHLNRCVVVGSVFVSSYALIQWAGFDPDRVSAEWLRGQAQKRTFSTLGGPAPLGAYLMVADLLAMRLMFERRTLDRALGIFGLTLGAPALISTMTRSAWLGALAGMGVFVLARGILTRRAIVILLTAAIFCIAGLAYVRVRRGTSDWERLEVWRAAVAMFRDHPRFGVGPDGFWSSYKRYRSVKSLYVVGALNGQADANNDWLQVMSTLGLAGLAAYAWLHISAARALVRQARLDGWDSAQSAAMASLAALFVYAKLNSLVWILVFLAAMLAGGLLAKRESGHRPTADKKAPKLIVMALGIVLAGGCAWLAWADRYEYLGVRARVEGRPREAAELLEKAIVLRPQSTVYRMNLDNLLWDVAEFAPNETRLLFLRRASAAAAEGVRRRPYDSDLLALMGRAELRRADWGKEDRLDFARLALVWALRLDPYSPQVAEDAARAELLSKRTIRN